MTTMLVLTLALALTPTPPPVSLAAVAAALAGSPAWQAEFDQEYLPAGFDQGNREHGTVVIAPPARIRFDYGGPAPRVFALDGNLARSVDPSAGTCDAVRIDQGAWERLPLAALLDPASAERSFQISSSGATLHLTPREPSPELVAIDVRVDASHFVTAVEVVDQDGNKNRFGFRRWRKATLPAQAFFRPALAGSPPCLPEGK